MGLIVQLSLPNSLAVAAAAVDLGLESAFKQSHCAAYAADVHAQQIVRPRAGLSV
jgi:hypothetical protein